MKQVSFFITAILALMGCQAMIAGSSAHEKSTQIRQKYKDAFSREAALFKNPEFYNKFAALKEAFQTKLNELNAKNLIASINITKEVEQIKKTYKNAFMRVERELNSPRCKKELIVDPMLVPIVNDQNNPYYDAIMQTIEDFKNALHKHAHQWMPNSYDTATKEFKNKEDDAITDLVGQYDPELKKALDEINALYR